MLYLFLNTNKIKLLYLKKSILGQYEAHSFEKKHEASLIEAGKITNTDLVASAIKEALTFTVHDQEKETCLILPEKAFDFLRFEVPKDIAQTAVHSFVKDKIRTSLSLGEDDAYFDYLIKENGDRREIILYNLKNELLKTYLSCLDLLDLKLSSVLPVTLSYHKLFEKTLRKEKREKIFYVHYGKDSLIGYLYDSFGLLNNDAWSTKSVHMAEFEELLKKKIKELEDKQIKLNRLILSGEESQNVRQDTFTKTIGVWTNLLKRILPNFYQDYLKLIIADKNTNFSYLNFDECFGAFVFSQEEKNFSLLKKQAKAQTRISLPSFKLPIKEIIIFIASFIFSFIVFSFASSKKWNFNFIPQGLTQATPTPTKSPTPTLTPTPTINKEKVKIKVLNGSGTAGKATAVKDILENKGYQEVLTGNADNFDYDLTEMQVKKSMLSLGNAIKNDLKDYTSISKIQSIDEDENADAIIIIGKDLK